MRKKRQIFAAAFTAFSLLLLSLASPDAVAQSGKFVTVDSTAGVQLYFEEAGSGDPVVFVPGWIMTSRYFDRQLKYFSGSKSTRFIVFDPRAQGRSSKTLDGANYVQHAHDLKKFIDQLGLKHVVLGGWSWGMDTVYAYLSIYGSDNIRAVVNIDQTPNPLASGEGAWTDGDITGVKTFFDAFSRDRVGTTEAFMPTFFTKPVSREELRSLTAETMMTPDIVAGLLYYDGWMFDSTKLVSQLKIPQLYYVNEANSGAAKSYIAKHCPQAELMALGGHAMFYDHAQAFNDRLKTFLAKHP
ncbi:MAG: alpha/beta hydrolase [Hyphomonadaceae bacterium]